MLTELYNDVVVRMAPVSETEAGQMIDQVKGFAVMRGYPRPAARRSAALARAVAALSAWPCSRAGRCAKPKSIR